MASQQSKMDRDGPAVVRGGVRGASDSSSAAHGKPLNIPLDLGKHGGARVLPNGTRLGEFDIVDLIDESGFGIVYLAYDRSLERHVAIKEYMPSGMAARTLTLHVSVRSKDQAAVFKAGMHGFVNQARLMAQFDSPSLVKVFRFWEDNNTAYMAMPFYKGITLIQAYEERRIVPTEKWIKLFLVDMCEALEMMHGARCYHCGIAPDNILVLSDGRPMLLGLGAAPQATNDHTPEPTAILKPGFTPTEQYANSADLKQGPWTDIYALGAVVYYLMTGKVAASADARHAKDDIFSANQAVRTRYGDGFLAAIERALAVRPEHRFQNIEGLRNALEIDADVSKTVPPVASAELPRPEPTIRTMSSPTLEAANTQRIDPRFSPVDSPTPPPVRPSAPRAALVGPPRLKIGAGAVALALMLAIGGGMAYTLMNGNQQDTFEPEDTAALLRQQAPFLPIGPPSAATPSIAADTPGDQSADSPHAPAPAPNLAWSTPQARAAQDRAAPAAPTAPPSEARLSSQSTTAGTPGGHQANLEHYPKGRPAGGAAEQLARLQPPHRALTTAPVSAPVGESTMWSQVNRADTATGYEAYLVVYPNGEHARTARNRRDVMKEKESVGAASTMPQAAANRPAAPDAASPARATIATTSGFVKETAPIAATRSNPPRPHESDPGAPRAGTTIRVAGQTFAGNFAADPATGIVSGSGRVTWSNGDRFDGAMVNGIKQGQGEFVWSNGQRYKGSWAHDLPNGAGSLHFGNGNDYVGQVKDGAPNGKGALKYGTGGEYQGGFNDGVPDGNGVNTFKNGDVYEGHWARGKSNGHGKYTWANGNSWEGEFRNDQRSSNGKAAYTASASGVANAPGARAADGADAAIISNAGAAK